MNVGSLYYSDSFFADMFGAKHTPITCVDDLDQIDLLVFWGGSDVTPKYYGEKDVKAVGTDPDRDKFEKLIYDAAALAIPMLGICRGAQFLCVMNGGKLWQHVDGHGRDHTVKMVDGSIFTTTSTHHQMMRPTAEMEILGTTTTALSHRKISESGETLDAQLEPEIVYAPLSNSLMIQGHPEYSSASRDFVFKTRQLINKYLGVK